MGKTCLFRELEAQLDRRRHHAVYLASSRASVTGIVRLLARHLHLRPRRSYLETLSALTQTLAVHSARIVLWLDEAEQLDLATLERLRTLVEADPAAPSFSVVLSGGPELASRLDSPRLLALARRITPRCTLAGLRRDELDGFLVHRFGVGASKRLPASIHDELFERTSATPALLDRVVRRALARHQGAIDDDEVRASLDQAGL
jgi:type II secretory pathway predicted ATPase ExeA